MAKKQRPSYFVVGRGLLKHNKGGYGWGEGNLQIDSGGKECCKKKKGDEMRVEGVDCCTNGDGESAFVHAKVTITEGESSRRLLCLRGVKGAGIPENVP